MIYELKCLLKCWFGDCVLTEQWYNIWFNKNDIQKVDNILKTSEPLINNYLEYDTDDIRELIALTILYDQVPRHIYRNTKKAYDYQSISLNYAKKALQQKIDLNLYYISIIICLIHTENIDEQILAKKTLDKCDITQEYKIALNKIINNHYERVSLFGRIPERNKILSRENTVHESVYLNAIY